MDEPTLEDIAKLFPEGEGDIPVWGIALVVTIDPDQDPTGTETGEHTAYISRGEPAAETVIGALQILIHQIARDTLSE